MFDWSFLAFMTCRATFREFLAFACGVITTTLLSTLPGWVVQNPLFAKGTWTRNRTPMNSLLFYSFYSICVCKYPRITFIQHHRMHQVLGSPASSHATLSHVGRSGCSCSVVLLGHGGQVGTVGTVGTLPRLQWLQRLLVIHREGLERNHGHTWYVSKVNRSNSFESSSQVHPFFHHDMYFLQSK